MNNGSAPMETGMHHLEGLYDELYPKVYNYARFRLKDPVAADEVAARTFEKAFEKIPTFDPDRGSLSAWILAIARNTVVDHVRTAARRRKKSVAINDDIPDVRSRPDQLLIELETKEELLDALSGLSVKEREIISLKFTGRLTNREIAGMLGLSETNVGVILYRAIRRLRRLLEMKR